MNYLVKTNGDPLNVRSAANGEILGSIKNGTVVTTIGKPVHLAGNSWIEIQLIAHIPGDRQWVAEKYLVAVTSGQNYYQNNYSTLPVANLSKNSLNNSIENSARIIAISSDETIGGGLRVYYAQLIDQAGKVIDTVRCISGRTWNQTPSHENGSESPLPFGVYTFDHPGNVEYLGGEFGGVWSGITPTFPTARNALGIHFDPSAFANDQNTGTAGCLATPTEAEKQIMTDFIVKYQPTHLIVQQA